MLEQLARLSYLAWDAVFLCFSVNSMRSFNSARTQVCRSDIPLD